MCLSRHCFLRPSLGRRLPLGSENGIYEPDGWARIWWLSHRRRCFLSHSDTRKDLTVTSTFEGGEWAYGVGHAWTNYPQKALTCSTFVHGIIKPLKIYCKCVTSHYIWWLCIFVLHFGTHCSPPLACIKTRSPFMYKDRAIEVYFQHGQANNGLFRRK